VHLLGRTQLELDFARSLGFDNVWTEANLPELPFDAVIDASNAPYLPARALELVEPAGRLVYIGLASTPSVLDTRGLVFNDVTAIGVLSGSPALEATIQSFAEGIVDPRPLVAATLNLDSAGAILAGERPADAGPGPKFHFDPRL
jgi:D-arabinose 1-dehydrogenase-like Zn-dependent alcohol dehydrogenase